jgi:cell division septal protein FtsQ
VRAVRRPTVRAAALPARDQLPDLGYLIPSTRSVAVGLALAVVAVGAYLAAWHTSAFAVRTIDVRGATPQIRSEVRLALADEAGTSLLSVSGAAIASHLEPLPEVRSFTYDRAFPNTLRVVVKRESPVLVVRRVPGNDAMLVAASGKVIRELRHPRLSHLPRVWVKKEIPISIGARLPREIAGAAAALSSLQGAGLPGGVRTVSVGREELTLTLGRGLQVRLGDTGDLRLKLAIARRILRLTGAAAAGAGYVDVSVPERPVISTQSQVVG